jgi:hypothetical protein
MVLDVLLGVFAPRHHSTPRCVAVMVSGSNSPSS